MNRWNGTINSFLLWARISTLIGLLILTGCLTPRDLSVGHTLSAKSLTEEKGQHDEAIQQAKKSIALDPTYAPGWYWLGIAHYRKARYDEAIPALTKVIQLKPSGPQYQSSYEYLGWSYYFKNNYENGINNFNSSLDLKPTNQSSLRGRAWCYYQLRTYDRAIHDFSKALEHIQATNKVAMQDALRGQAWSYYMNADFEKAIQDFNKALEYIDANNKFAMQDALRGRAWCSYKNGDFEKAIQDFNKALEYIQATNKFAMRDSLRGKAFSYLGLGGDDTAVNLIHKAKEALDYDTSYVLSLISYVTGDTEKAWEYRGGKGMVGVYMKDYKKEKAVGVEVIKTTAGGPAEKAGMLAGDVMISLNGANIEGVKDFTEKARILIPGTTAKVVILREGLNKELSLQVASAESLMESAPIIAPIMAKKSDKTMKKVAKAAAPKTLYPPGQQLPPPRVDTYAVIIGIDYKDRADIPSLKFPSQDAQKIYEVLTDPRYGGVPRENAILLINNDATRNKMIAALRTIKTRDGYVYVYFSGHGAPEAQGEKLVDAFMIPNDVIISDPEALADTSIRLSYLQNLVETSQAQGVMIALDACFTGGGKSIVPKGGKPLVGVLASPELIKPQGSGKVIITSSAINQQSWEDDTEIKGGIFSHYLLEGLRGKAGKTVWVKVNELASYVRETVPRAARKLKGIEQTPQISGSGDFAVTRNWARAKVMDREIAREKLKGAFEKGHITVKQLNRALDELKTLKRSKTLEAFLEGKLDSQRFGGLY